MEVLARKVSRAKWPTTYEDLPNIVPADAITGDLRTSSNTLSFWRCDSSESEDLERAVIALASGAERPDQVQLVYLSESALRAEGISLTNTKGFV